MNPPSWTATAIWYAVYPLGMVGAPIHDRQPDDSGHRLGRLIDWLDHLVELGCNGLLLGPIFESVTHGYDTLDYFRLDARLGDDADFDALIAACRQRGIRVLLDGVFNHVSARHPALLEALANPQAPSAEWFHIDYTTDPPTRLNFEGSDDLVLLNHSAPAVVRFVSRVMTHWLERGIDGWRLDAAYAVPAEFWAKVLPGVRERFPEALFVGEVIHADLGWVETSRLDSITAYELWKASWSAIHDRNWFELDWTMQRHDELLDQVRPLTFVSNHDVTRIVSQIGEEGALLAMIVLASTGGMPSVYYGDEGGIRGVKYERARGDDEVRPAMPAEADWTPPVPWLLDAHRALIALRRRHPWLVDARHTTLKLDNEYYVYRASSGDDWIEVELDLTRGYRARITGPDGDLYRFEKVILPPDEDTAPTG